MLRESDSVDSAHLDALTNFYRAEAVHQEIIRECYPTLALNGQELLKRVANVVGLSLPKEVKLKSSQVIKLTIK